MCLFAEAFAIPGEDGPLGNIGGHELIEEIARGGMGVVYRARQREPERIVALKTMRGAELDSPAALERFRQEAKAMADLEHAAILPVFAFGEQDGIPFFTMKLATGGTLAKRLGAYAGKWREIAALVACVADAVQHAHTRAVLHRDLKPANILFDEKDRAFVSDFGLAKLLGDADAHLTHSTAVLGTPHYLAPEIAAHDARAATTASDVWSLGVILYELLAQRRPFEGDAIPAILRAITDSEPAPLREVPRDLVVIAMKALAKEPARRYASAGALAEDLRRWLDGRPILARPVSPVETVALWARRNPLLATIAFAAVAFLVAGVTGIAIQGRRAEMAERITRERLAHEHIRTGLRMAEDGDALRGLPHYVEALRLGLGDAGRERVARLRFEMTVRQAPRLAQLWLPEATGEVQFAEEAGRVVISAGRETRVWDAATGVAVSPPMHHPDDLLHMWTDARGTRVVTEPHDDRITVWDAASGIALATLPGEGHLRAVLGGPRLRLAAWQRDAGTVACISAVDGAVDATFYPPEKVEWTVVTPDGARILAASKKSLMLWDVAARELVVPPLEFGGEPDFGNFDPSGHIAGLRVKHKGVVALFDLTTGTIIARGETRASGSIKHGWLNGSQWVVLTRKVGGSTLREGATDWLLLDAQLGARTVTSEFAARRNVFALAGENGASQLWECGVSKPITPRLWVDGRPERLCLSSDGATVLISSSEPAVRLWKLPAPGGTEWISEPAVRLWKPPAPGVVEWIEIGPRPALAAWWDAAGTVLRIVSEDALLTTRDAVTGQTTGKALALNDGATHAAPDASGRLVLVAGLHGARLWNAESGQPARPLIPCASAIIEVALSADGGNAAVLLQKETLLCDPATGTVRHTLATEGALHCLLDPDGTRLVTLAKTTVQLWDAASGETIGAALEEGGKWSDPGACFDAAGKRLALWWSWPDTLAGSLRVLEPATGREILPRLQHSSAVKHASFSATGDRLATATRDQRLWVWRMSDGSRALAPIQHDDRISDAGFSPDGLLVWSRSNRVLRLWEAATGDAVSVLTHHGLAPAKPKNPRGGPMENDEIVSTIWRAGSRVASCDSRGAVNVWDPSAGTRPLDEMEMVARVLSRHRIETGGGLVPLTREELRAAWAAHR